MALPGKIIAHQHDQGQYGFEYVTTVWNEPKRIRQVWPISTIKTDGMSFCRVEDALDKPAEIRDGIVTCYLGNGNWVRGSLPQLGQTKHVAFEETPIPPPRCRSETRWKNGRWEKYLLSKGWVAA